MGKLEICTKEKEEYMSYEDFSDFCDEDTLAEWVDGKIREASRR
jgi:hypothetical protein